MLTAYALLNVLLVFAVILGLLAGLRQVQLRSRLDAEAIRKLFHIGGGMIGISLPWLFDQLAPVLLLGVFVAVLFLGLRRIPALRTSLGQVLLAVQRPSIGDFCLLASFGLLFWLARGDKLLYSIPILVVTLADALAALIGQTYGKLPLQMRGDRKTLEGAITFLLTAFFCIHVPVLLWGGTGRLESLLIAADIGLMVMLAEAAVWWGLDNLIVPILAYMALKSLLAMDAPHLLLHLGFVLALSGVMIVVRKHTTLGDDALAGGVLWGYVVWAVGGWEWVLPPLLQLVAYAHLIERTAGERRQPFGFSVVLANIVGSIPWLLAYRETGDHAFYVPFVACYGMNMAIVTLVRLLYVEPVQPPRRLLVYSLASGMLVGLPSLLGLYRLQAMLLVGVLTLIASVIFATLVFRGKPPLTSASLGKGRHLRQAIVVAVGSFAAFGLQSLQVWLLPTFK